MAYKDPDKQRAAVRTAVRKHRANYRIELNELRKSTGINIPFGANLGIYRSKKAEKEQKKVE